MQILTQTETCAFLRISRTTLWKLRKRGDLVGFHVGGKILFTENEILRYMSREGRSGIDGRTVDDADIVHNGAGSDRFVLSP